MRRLIRVYEDDHYKFFDFSMMLRNIRDSYLDELELFDEVDNLKLTSRFHRRYLKHSTLMEIFTASLEVNVGKTNVILMDGDFTVDSGGLFDTDEFSKQVRSTINSCKRNIPILMKNTPCCFEELDVFLGIGEGEEFLLQVDSDRDKLRNATCTFQEFKRFIKKTGLSHLGEELINKIAFKRLFFS